jgi:hypothetical protein
MQLGRQDAADKSYLPTSELKTYTPKRTGKDLSALLSKEGGVQVILTFDFNPRLGNSQHVAEMLTTC